MNRVVRNAVLGAVIAALPISTAVAAVRPATAVPTATSTAVAAQETVYVPVYETRRRHPAETWPAILALVGMGLLVLYFVFDEDEREPLTRA